MQYVTLSLLFWVSLFLVAAAAAEEGRIARVGLLSTLPYVLETFGDHRDIPTFGMREMLASPLKTLKLLQDPDSAGSVEEKVSFICSSRAFPTPTRVYLNMSSSYQFNYSLPTYFWAHGFIDGYYNLDGSLQLGIKQLLKYVDGNVCAVDWSSWAAYDYITSIRFLYLVAEYLANFLLQLHSCGLQYKNLTLIGFSLGSHLVGWTGKLLHGQVGSIIATDPAGLGFTELAQMVYAERRLSRRSAKNVQTINTTPGMISSRKPLGHENFYPNLGLPIQPGCTMNGIDCDHSISNYYLISSFNPDRKFVGVQCPNQLAAIADDIIHDCNYERTNILGLRSKRIRGNFFFRTTNKLLPTPF